MIGDILNHFKILLRIIVLTLVPFNLSLAKDFDEKLIRHPS